MAIKNNKLIVVLGMHRSGTSAITRGLEVLGVSMGNRLLPSQGDNFKGFWEDIDLNELNIEMLNILEIDWYYLAPITARDLDILHEKGYFSRALDFLREKINSEHVFGFKDPRVAKLLPFWKEVFNQLECDVIYVLTLRHPLSVAESLAKRDGFDLGQSYYLWLGHVITSLVYSVGNKRVLVDYDCLLQLPERELLRIGVCIGQELSPTKLQIYKTEFLDEELRHTAYDLNDLLLADTCPYIVREIYSLLLKIASDKIKLDDVELQTKVECWAEEFDGLKIPLRLTDGVIKQKEMAAETVVERDLRIARLNLAIARLDEQVARLGEQVVGLNEVAIDREGHIANLNQTLAELEKNISDLNHLISERSEQVNRLSHIVVERDNQIEMVSQSVVDRDGLLNNLNQIIIERDNVVQELRASNSWRFTRPLRVIKSTFVRIWKSVRVAKVLPKRFDARWYLEQHQDVVVSGMDPYEHYTFFGKAEGRPPSPDFYITRNIRKLQSVVDLLPAFISTSGGVSAASLKVIKVISRERWSGVVKRVSILQAQLDAGDSQKQYEIKAYKKYMATMEPSKEDLEALIKSVVSLSYRPKFSIVVPVYNVEKKWLTRFIESVLAQIYPDWELCIADDHSTAPHIKPLLEYFAAKDSRIRLVFRDVNGHISEATNTALEMATGDFVCLMDNDDEIAPHALYEFAALLNRDGAIDMIYSDEDKIDVEGNRYDPFFKPDWSPEALEGCMYTAHFACYRTSLVHEVGGFRSDFNGAQDYDFVLRFTELAKKIAHIPKILYHWRAIPGSTAASMSAKDYVLDSALRALTERAKRVAGGGEASLGLYSGSFDLRYNISRKSLVSIVIPSAGRMARIAGKNVDLLSQVVISIHENSTYRNFEIIIVDNDDLRDETVVAIKPYDCKYIHFKGEFNIATKMNLGAREARGEYLLFLNDDIEIITPDWIECMLQLCQRKGVGVVGAKLHYENESLQHAGVAFWNGLPDHIFRAFPATHPGYFFSAVANRNYLALTGAALMTKRELFETVNGFDEEFAVNYNDIDFCLRVFEEGFRIVFAAGARLFHYESVSREAVVAPEEIELFKKKWKDVVSNDPYYSRFFDSHPPVFALRHEWQNSAIPFPEKSPVISHC